MSPHLLTRTDRSGTGTTRNETTRTDRMGRWVPYALVALVLIPAVAGSLRLVELSGGAQLMPANPRLTSSPFPVVVHIISAVSYAVIGAFQFSPGLRRRHPKWHRLAGRFLVLLGLAVAFSALWMTLFYARQPGTGTLLYIFRLMFGSGMAACIILGFNAIRRGDVAHHLAWMTRAYALALGAGWAINLGVAEYLIRRSGRHAPAPAVNAGLP